MGRGEVLTALVSGARGYALALCALVMLALLCSPAPAAAAAQLRPQPVPAVLTDVKLLSENPDESRFELRFSPKATSYAPMAQQQPTQ